MRKITRLIELKITDPKLKVNFEIYLPNINKYAMEEFLAIYDPSLSMRFGVHTNLFTSSILNQSSPEQLSKLEHLVKLTNNKIIFPNSK
jgi:hypothetical protein